MARRLVTSSMTSRDSGVIAVTSHSSKSSHLEIRTRINYTFGPFKHKLWQNVVLKSTHSAKMFGKSSIWRDCTPKKIGTFHDDSNATSCFTSGSVKLTGLDRISFDVIIHANHYVD